MMKIIQTSDYMIFFDNVRVDPYIVNWSSKIGLTPSDATASITMYRTDAMDNWKAYLTQVRIFSRNIFTEKYGMVFEGEIMDRSWHESRANMGMITFNIKGAYHWLDIPIPLMISTNESLDKMQRFIYEAQNMNVEELQTIMKAREEILLKDKTIEEVIFYLLEQLNKGYYDIARDNSSFGWAKMKDRFKVMVDVLKEFRQAGFMDLFTFTKGTQIQTFYVYLNEILSQLMFEFYQDRDGALRIKNPSWADAILKNHVLDESIVTEVSGMDDWDQEPTRVLAIGGTSELMKQAANGGYDGYGAVSNVPMGLYIGTPKDGKYYSQTIEMYLQNYGVGMDDLTSLANGIVNTGEWYDNLTDNYTLTSGHRSVNSGRPDHRGTDYGMRYEPLYNIGTTGKVVAVKPNNDPGGIRIYIEENINGILYEFRYMHLSETNVRVGDTVAPGQLIGKTGNTGVGSGPHLHLECWEGGRSKGVDINVDKFLRNQKKLMEQAGKLGANASIGEWMEFECTAYTVGPESTGKGPGDPAYGITATGKNVGDTSVDHRVIAVDPKVIPLHSVVEIEGMGTFTAEDTGGAIKGNRIDILFNNLSKAYQFGRQKKKARVIRSGKDGQTVGTGGKGNSTPFANVDGFKLPPGMQKMKELEDRQKAEENAPPKSVKYKSAGRLLYDIPSNGTDYRNSIIKNSSGVDSNLVCSIIGVTSGWREKYSTSTHKGLMAIPNEYSNAVLKGKNLFNGYNSIEYGTQFFAECMKRFKNKVTFSLAAYWLGNMGKVEEITKNVGALDFVQAKSQFDKSTISFVEKVIDTYVDLSGADYIEGDPHKDFGEDVFYHARTSVPRAQVTNEELPDYESSYKPIMSDEEYRYKINLKIVEQQLIRNDSPAVDAGSVMGAEELVFRYAKYMMQLYRARAHNIAVPLSISIPSIRPGFNAWLEPSRKNVVFYVTSVSHQGSFGQGCFTVVNGGFVRNAADYDDIDESIFVGEQNASAADFGNVVKKENMDTLRSQLVKLNDTTDEVVDNARNIKPLQGLYASGGTGEVDFVTQWNKEYAADDLVKAIADYYKNAPPIIKKRTEEISKVMKDSESTFTKLLFKTSF